MSTVSNDKVLTMDSINANYVAMEYAVRGPIVIRAGEIEKELLKVSALRPFQFTGMLYEFTLRAYTHAIYRARPCTTVGSFFFFLCVLVLFSLTSFRTYKLFAFGAIVIPSFECWLYIHIYVCVNYVWHLCMAVSKM